MPQWDDEQGKYTQCEKRGNKENPNAGVWVFQDAASETELCAQDAHGGMGVALEPTPAEGVWKKQGEAKGEAELQCHPQEGL